MNPAEPHPSPTGEPLGGGPPSSDAGRDGVDPDLLALPAPPGRRRTVTLGLMAAVGAVAVLLFVQLLPDVRYFFGRAEVTDLGPATSLDPAALPVNAHVRVGGLPMASSEVRYDRPFGGGSYLAFPLAGQRDLLVQVRTDGVDGDPAARRDWSGRLVTFAALGGRYAAVRDRFADGLGLPVTDETFLLLADEAPATYAPRVALAAFCLFVLLLDAVILLRWFRPIRDA